MLTIFTILIIKCFKDIGFKKNEVNFNLLQKSNFKFDDFSFIFGAIKRSDYIVYTTTGNLLCSSQDQYDNHG